MFLYSWFPSEFLCLYFFYLESFPESSVGFFVLATPHSLWDLSPSTRDPTLPAVEAQSPNHQTAGEVPFPKF